MKFHEDIARRKLNAPPEWRACILKRIGPDATFLEGAIPRELKSGPRKGRPTWKGMKLESCIVTDVEVDAERKAYESSTGNCSTCLGEKKVVVSVSVSEGTKYGTCKNCAGTGCALTPK